MRCCILWLSGELMTMNIIELSFLSGMGQPGIILSQIQIGQNHRPFHHISFASAHVLIVPPEWRSSQLHQIMMVRSVCVTVQGGVTVHGVCVCVCVCVCVRARVRVRTRACTRAHAHVCSHAHDRRKSIPLNGSTICNDFVQRIIPFSAVAHAYQKRPRFSLVDI